MVFHESLHAGPFDTVQAELDGEFARHNAKDDVQLWHAVLFYTAGEIVRDATEDASKWPAPRVYTRGVESAVGEPPD